MVCLGGSGERLAFGPRKNRRQREKENGDCGHAAGGREHHDIQRHDDAGINRARRYDQRSGQEQNDYRHRLGDDKAEHLAPPTGLLVI